MERTRTQSIRDFIIEQAALNPLGLARRIAEAYGISRQAANRHLDLLVEAALLEETGQTRARVYRLRRTSALSREVRVTPVLNPDRLWEDHIAPILAGEPAATRDLCRGAFGELMRNAAEHAGASWIQFSLVNNACDIDISVSDDGAGIFRILQEPLGAASPRETAQLLANLANARAADSPAARLVLLARHFHSFSIRSAGSALTFTQDGRAWAVGDDDAARKGTSIVFRLRRASAVASHTRVRRGAAVTR